MAGHELAAAASWAVRYLSDGAIGSLTQRSYSRNHVARPLPHESCEERRPGPGYPRPPLTASDTANLDHRKVSPGWSKYERGAGELVVCVA